MTHDRLLSLLEKCDEGSLSQAEERELEQLLEERSNRDVAESRISDFRSKVADLHAYRRALEANSPRIPADVLTRLVSEVSGENREKRGPKVMPFPHWRISFGVAAMAACVAVMVWVSARRHPPIQIANPASVAKSMIDRGAKAVFEFGIVAGPAMLRDVPQKAETAIGEGWRLSALASRAELETWSKAELPTEVQGRVWIDEDAGVLRAVYRRNDGTMGVLEQPVETRISIPDQLARIRLRLPGNQPNDN